MEIRVMTQEDIPFATDITDREGWGYAQDDFRQILLLDPEGCFVAFDGDRRIGMLTTVNYGKTAWIGNVVTESYRRGEGIGSKIVLHAVEHLKKIGVRNVALYSYLDSISFYKRMGFKESFRVSRFTGPSPDSDGRGANRTTESDLQKIVDFDQGFFPGNRYGLLKLMLMRSPTYFLHVGDEVTLGYIAGFCSPKACEIGPWVCHPDHPDIARDLLEDCLSALESDTTSLGIPNENTTAMRIIEREGFAKDFEVVGMFFETDESGMDLEAIFGVGSLEMG
jgi:predicted N-acetyltransferase YhbS